MDPKKQLQKLIDDFKTKQFRQGEAKGIVQELKDQLIETMKPALGEIAASVSDSVKQSIQEALKDIKIEVPEVSIPDISVDIPEIQVPEAKVKVELPNIPAPIVNIPKSDFQLPDKFYVEGGVDLPNVSPKRPLAVRLYDGDGKPFAFPIASGGMSGGKADFFTISNFGDSAFAGLQDPDGRLKVVLPSGATGLTDTELRAAHLDVQQLSGAVDSVSLVSVSDIFSTTTTSTVVNPDNRVRVELPAGATGLTDTELRASSVPVAQASGANWSVYATNPVAQGDSTTALRFVHAGDVGVSVTATQTGTWNIGTVTSITNSLAANIVDSSGVAYTTTNPLPVGDAGGSLTVDGTVAVSSVSGSIAANIVDSSGVAYTTTNPLPIGDAGGSVTIDGTITGITNAVEVRQVSGAVDSVIVNSGTITTVTAVTDITNSLKAALIDSSGVQYSGSNPVPTTVVSGALSSSASVYTRQTNPTAVASDYVPLAADDLGRQLVRPIQVRDLIKTAYATLSTQAETTVLSATAGSFNDLIMITGTNGSSSAFKVDIRAVTGGNIIHTLYLPANTGPVGFVPSVPWPQDATGNNWTATISSGSDISNANVYISGLFSTEV